MSYADAGERAMFNVKWGKSTVYTECGERSGKDELQEWGGYGFD